MTCRCEFDKDPELHDQLLGIESMTPVEAAQLVADLISVEDRGTGDEILLEDADDFGRFVGQHNWKDPVAMYKLGQSVDLAMNIAAERRNIIVIKNRELIQAAEARRAERESA